MKATTATSILALTWAYGAIALRPGSVAAQTTEPAKPSTGLTESAQLAQATGTSGTDAPTRASEGAGLEEIVVTATRRSERLQDVPVSVLAFSREKIDAGGLHNIDDLARLSPGVTFQRTSGNYNDEGSTINIRGIDSTAGASTTGIYIDDTPIQVRQLAAGSINAYPALIDLDRVEVLRGLQGTLFGAGAEGGVVRFISPEPDLGKVSAYSRVDVANTAAGGASYQGGGAFGAPIIDGVLAFRASVSFERDGGWVNRVGYSLIPDPAEPLPTPVYNGHTTEANANWQETATARLAVKWKVNDSLEISPSIYYQRLRINDTAVYWVPLSNPGANVYRNGNARANSSNDPFTLSAIKLKWDLGFASLLSNTSFYARNQSAPSDSTQYLRATWSNAGVLANTFPAVGDNGYAPFRNQQRNFYQEIRLASKDANARVIWSGGVFYSHLKENVSESIIDPTLNQEVINYTADFPGGPYAICTPGDPVLQCPGGLLFYGPLEQVIDKQVAFFGEIGLKLTDTLKATAGLAAAGIGPEDIDVVELHDCFAQNELISYEALGLCPVGGAEKFVCDGDNSYGGKIVTNPSGGLLSKGHPLGATGLAQCTELVQQLRGSAAGRQVENARLALQHNLGLGGACVVTLYERI